MYLTSHQAKQKILAEKYDGVESPDYQADCARIDAHEPWEYVLGYAEFLGCRIDLSDKPMVPRDETAHWVKRVIAEWNGKGPLTALDLYAGSGNIGIALLQHLSESRVTFNELDAALLPQIEKSLVFNGIDSARATLIAGDSFEKVTGTFDVICANPPYVRPESEADMDPEMRYEPHIAFFGSSDGLAHHRELIEKGRQYLTQRGVLYGEFDMTQTDEIKRLLEESPDWRGRYEIWNDPYGHEGIFVLRA